MRCHDTCAFTLVAAVALAVLWLPVAAFAQEMPQFPGPDQDVEMVMESAGACGACGCVGVLVFVVVCWAIFIAIAVYVYRDAQARGMDSPVLWLLLVIVTGLIGLVIYLIVRPPKPQQ